MCIQGGAHFPPCGDLPDGDGSVHIAQGHEVIVPKGRGNGPCWKREPGSLAVGGHVPQPKGPTTLADEGLAVRREGHGTALVSSVPGYQELDVAPRGHVPEVNAMLSSRCQDLAVRREGERPDPVGVPAQGLSATVTAEPPKVAPLEAA